QSVVLCCCLLCFVFVVFFFFQAEDGIRDDLVTGVQTCALPISLLFSANSDRSSIAYGADIFLSHRFQQFARRENGKPRRFPAARSEERRVGKECRSRWWPTR